MKKASLFLIFVCLSTTIRAQVTKDDWVSTGRHYFGAEIGITNTIYSGQEKFQWPIRQQVNDPDDGQFTANSYASFDDLGKGFGFVFDAKLGFSLAHWLDLETKLGYLTNYTSREEDNKLLLPIGGTFQLEPVTNSYNLLLSNLIVDEVAHIGITNDLYLAGGIGFSSLLSNSLYVHQIKHGGDDWRYTEVETGFPSTNDTEMTFGSTKMQNMFSSSRLGALVGLGTVTPLSPSMLLDAELLVSIPFTNWMTSAGEDSINHWSFYTNTTTTFPKLWYASLTIGLRFPFEIGGGASSDVESGSGTNTASENRPGETRAEIDAEGKVPLTGRVSDNNGKSVDANITVVDLTSNEVVGTDHTGSNGRYSVRVKAPGKYSVTADADGYLFGTAYFEVDKDGRILATHPDIKLSETTNGRTRLLVFFDFNSSELKPSSYPELNRAVKLMKAVPKMQVEIAGYTDSVGSPEFNKNLSDKRANAVRDYLVKNGIVKKRIAAKGYGEDSPIADNATEEGRAENRRVEFVVLSK